MTPNSLFTFFEIFIALHTKLFLLSASLPLGSFKLCSILGKRAIAGISNEDMRSISFAKRSKENL